MGVQHPGSRIQYPASEALISDLSFSCLFLPISLPCIHSNWSWLVYRVFVFNWFRSFEFWPFGFVSDFGFRASDLAAATPHADRGGVKHEGPKQDIKEAPSPSSREMGLLLLCRLRALHSALPALCSMLSFPGDMGLCLLTGSDERLD
jgi:hypothetical protein